MVSETMAIQTKQSPTRLAPAVAESLPIMQAEANQLLVPVESPLAPAKRLLVLVPDGVRDDMALAQQVWTLAQPRSLPVMYLGLVAQAQQEPRQRRRLALLAACTRDPDGVRADFGLAVGGDWLTWVCSVWRPGDLVVCHAEQHAWPLWTGRALSQAVVGALHTPVYVLSGLCNAEPNGLAHMGRTVLFWAGALILAAVFFWLQVNIQSLAQDWVQTAGLALSVIVEFSLLAAWSRWLQ